MIRSFFLATAVVGALYAVEIEAAPKNARPRVLDGLLQDDFPFQRAAIRVPLPPGNLAEKGIAIRVGNDAALLFDTDRLRWAAGWTGGFITTEGVSFDGGHGKHPAIDGEQVFGLGNQPGWADADGTFRDPRPEPFGPLPAEWCRWDGIYVSGMRVILAYTVHGVRVTEQPDAIGGVFKRTFKIGKNARELKLALCAVGKGNPELSVGLLEGKGIRVQTVDGVRVATIPAGFGPGMFAIVIGGKDDPSFETAMKSGLRWVDVPSQGAKRWPERVVTKGALETSRTPDGAYVTDRITPPLNNPWKRRVRFGGVDFFSDGTSAALSTWDGDVWKVTGIDEHLNELVWTRVSSGGFENLGLKIVDGVIYTGGRDEITRHVDLNGDGETDYYENFCNLFTSSQGFHEFCFDLHRDDSGNFYFAKAGPVRAGGRGFGGGGGNGEVSRHAGTLMKVDKTGRTLEVVATGFRAPTGMGLGPDGQLTTGDNEGTWVPACPINWVKPGGFYGVEDLAHGRDAGAFLPPLCWITKSWDNSGGGQAWVPDDRWGPFAGELLHSSYGRSALYLVMKEEVGGQMQGGIVKIPVRFTSSAMRLRFNPRDGQLYNAGLKGWQSNAVMPAGLDRVRYTGRPVFSVRGLKVDRRGVHLTFTQPLQRGTAEDVGNYHGERWNYRRTSNYGSPEYSVSDPDTKGHDELAIESATLSPDGRTVTLKIADLKPVMQQRIEFRGLRATDGTEIRQEILHTINVLK